MKIQTTAKVVFSIFFFLLISQLSVAQKGPEKATAYLYPTQWWLCYDGTLEMKVKLTGVAPFTLSYESNRNGVGATLIIQQNEVINGEYTFYVSTNVITQFWITSFSDANGPGTATWSREYIYPYPPKAKTPTLSASAICTGGTLTMQTIFQPCGSVDWQYSTDNVKFISFGNNPGQSIYATNKLTHTGPNSTRYYIRARAYSGRYESFTQSVPVDVYPAVVAGAITVDRTIACEGYLVNLKISGQTGQVTWEQYDSGKGIFVSTGATGTTYNPRIIANTTFRAKVSNGYCTVYTNEVRVTIDNTTTSYIQSLAIPYICSGNSVSFNFFNYRGGTIQWMVSTDGVNFTDIQGETGQAYTTPLLYASGDKIVNYYYKVVTKKVACDEYFSSNVITVRVYKPFVNSVITSSAEEICSGEYFTLTVSNGQIPSMWETSLDGVTFSPAAGSTNTNTLTAMRSSNDITVPYKYVYYRAYFGSNPCNVNLYTNVVRIKVFTLPQRFIIRTAAVTNYCQGAPRVLTLYPSATISDVQWYHTYNNVTELIPGVTGISYTTPTYTNHTNEIQLHTFTAIGKNGTCSGTQTATYTHYVYPTATQAGVATSSSNVICNDHTVQLNISGSIGIITWQYSSDGINYTNYTNSNFTSFTTPSLTTGSANVSQKKYWFRARLHSAGTTGCVLPLAYSNPVEVTVSRISSPPGTLTASNTTICSGGNTTLTLTNYNTSYPVQWQVNDGSGFVVISGATSGVLNVSGLTSGATSKNYQYRAYAGPANNCAGSSNTITITVNPSILITAQPVNTPVCPGETMNVSVTATGQNLSYQWQAFNGMDYMDFVTQTNASLVIPDFFGIYQVRCRITDACGHVVYSNAVEIASKPAPLITVDYPELVCYGDEVTLTAYASQALGPVTFAWDQGIQNGVPFVPTQHLTYTVTATNTSSGCTSSKSIPLYLKPRPEDLAISGLNASYCQGENSVTLTGIPSGGVFSGPGISGDVFTPEETGNNIIVYTYLDGNGCTSVINQTTIVKDVLPAPVFCASGNGWCEPASVELCIFPPNPMGTYRLYDENMNLVSTPTATVVTPFINETTTFYLSVVNSEGCESDKAATEVHIDDMVMNDVTVCPGTVALHDYIVSPITPAPIVKFYNAQDIEISPSYNVTANTTLYAKAFYMNPIANTLCISDPTPFEIIVPSSCVARADNSSSQTSESSVLLYPNPASEEVHINISGMNSEVTVTILDVNGKEIYQSSVVASGNEIILNDLHFASGIYMLKVSDGQKVKSTLFTKIK